MRKKELVRRLAETEAALKRAIDKSWDLPTYPWIAKAIEQGKTDAKDYKPRRADQLDSRAGFQRFTFERLCGHPVGKWAYDYGYDLGARERDAFEDRRDNARAAIKNPTTIPPTPVRTASK